jgi:trans-aconitate 2-methyltransferase
MHVQFSVPGGSHSSAGEQYVRAALDLLSRVRTRTPRCIADLQAGSRSTKTLLAQRFPDSEIVSLDVSRPERLDRNEFDLIFLNGDLDLLSSLRVLLPMLVTRLSFCGSLAVQFPDNLYEPNRALLRMVAADGPWATKLLPVAKTRPFSEVMEDLYALLSPVCASVDVWETTYLCAFKDVGAIINFMEETSLPPFLRPLDETLRGRFLDRYATELARAYRIQPDGKVLMRFPRIFVLVQR